MAINICTYNMYGFNQGKLCLNELCSVNDVIAVQEHWLSKHDLNKIMEFHSDFQGFGWSAMDERLERGVLVGRPYGGLGLLVRKNLNIKVSHVTVESDCRCAAVKLCLTGGFQLLLIVVYFPCYEASLKYQNASDSLRVAFRLMKQMVWLFWET